MQAQKFEQALREVNSIPTFGIKIHPDANTVRMMSNEEYIALRDNIAKHGQLVPATICQGMLLDGRNRLKACEELGINLRVENAGDSDVDTVAMVYSLNVTRRHLNTAERAFMGADMANLEHGGDRKSKSKTDFEKSSRKYSRTEAAAIVECSPQDITAARNVRKFAPELEGKAKSGEIHIREAERLAKKKALDTGKVKPKEKPKEKPKVVPIKQDEIAGSPDASWDDLLAAVNITTDTVDQAKEDMMHPQYMVARRLDESKSRIIKAMTPLGKSERKKALAAVVDVLLYEQEVFQAEVKALMPKYNKELEARLKKEIDEQKKITADLRKKIAAGFDKKDFRVIRGVLHSDREPTKEQRDKAFNLFLKLEAIFS